MMAFPPTHPTASIERAALGCAFFILDATKTRLDYDGATGPAVPWQSSTTPCDAAFSPDALMWLLAREAALLQSGLKKS